MDNGARGWMLRTVRRNYWRVSRWVDLDDLIQEGYAAYYEVLKRYPTAVAPQHRMALFKLVLMSRITDLANHRTKSITEVCASDLPVSRDLADPHRADTFLETIAADADMSIAATAFAAAPQYVKDALALFTTDEGLARLRSAYRGVQRGGRLTRETMNERLCRLTGHDPRRVDIVGGLRACLTEE